MGLMGVRRACDRRPGFLLNSNTMTLDGNRLYKQLFLATLETPESQTHTPMSLTS